MHQLLNNLQFTGADFFADKDVCSIVLAVTNSPLGPKEIGLCHRTLDGVSGKWVQADRSARSSQAHFLAGEANAADLAGEAADDAHFVGVFAHSSENLAEYALEEGTRTARTLLPNVLQYDPNGPGGGHDRSF